ncbi:MAG: hypothetical protein NT062_22800 [Proteobacteria bacterium]|nr:hypothetical protein [Pseudomonadota bacterium]
MQVDEDLAQIGAILVEDRVLRRLIKEHRKLRGIGLQVPHAACYTIERAIVAQLVEPRELAIELAKLPDRVLAIGGDRAALAKGDPVAMTAAWRALYHARIHQVFEAKIADGTITTSSVRLRINRIGQTEFDEARYLLRQEDLLLPPVSDASTYTEFVALYLELRAFDPTSLQRTFSTLHDDAHVLATIRLDVDPEALLASARPPTAPTSPIVAVDAPSESRQFAAFIDRSAVDESRRARRKGNDARAAILAFRGGHVDAAELDLEKLVGRLGRALGGASTDGWADALAPLARTAAAQPSVRYTADARLFHDLQTACVVAEREVKTVDLVTWIRSRGKRPIVRPLPATREVRIAKHVRGATHKLPACNLEREDRERLGEILHHMVELAEAGARTVLRPAIERALDDVELHPKNPPEQVAEKKIVDELLDQAVSVGRLSLGNLRDAVSANELKLPDLAASSLWSDDQLLRADLALSISLDGVYRRGEAHLRFLQKLSSVMFGTATGRVLCLYALLPLLGAFTMLEGLQHMIGPLAHWLLGVEPEIATWPAFVGVSAYLFLLLHVRAVRTGTGIAIRALRTGLRFALVTLPRGFLQLTPVRMVLDSAPARWVGKPAIPAAIALLMFDGWLRFAVAGGLFVATTLLVNVRLGRLAQEYVTDWLVRSGRHVVRRLVPGVLRWVLDVFAKLVELSDRGLYRVDEWLRFRSGESVLALPLKGVLGFAWSIIAYLLRVLINVFIEPVVNPVKHFPVVTVAGKLMLPFTKAIVVGVKDALAPVVGQAVASGMATFTILMLPGVAGFLVWELKANWKLYQANRATTIHASAFGHHGETMVAMLKPGFHSGTIPKLFQKLRRATWKADERGIAKYEEGLHHVEEGLHKFVDRELVSLIAEAKIIGVAVDRVELAANRITITMSQDAADPATLTIEMQSGFIVAGIATLGWIARLGDHQREVFEVALAGFYKLAAVDIVREQLTAVLGDVPYDISDEGLVVWPGDGYQTEFLYRLRSNNLVPIVRGPTVGVLPRTLINQHVLYYREPLYWPMWATAWEQLVAGRPPERIIAGPDLLPRVPPRSP